MAFQTDSAGNIGLQYVWGPAADDLLAIRDAFGDQFYVVQDKLRSVRGLVRRDGTWLMSQRFGPYGAVTAQDVDTTGLGLVLRYAWTGREFDVETGFYYFRARYFDPALRRFVQEDPIGYASGGNLYAYAGGNPMDARDPSGLAWNYEAYMLDPNDASLFGNCFTRACSSDWGGGGGEFYLDGALVSGLGLRTVAPFLVEMMQRHALRNYLSQLAGRARGRQLDAYERVALAEVCSQLDCDRVRIVEGGDLVLLFTDGVTLGNTIYMRESAYSIDFLAHELTHVMQYQAWGGLEYYARGLGARVRDLFGDPYHVDFPLTRPFDDYGMEQQATIVQVMLPRRRSCVRLVFWQVSSCQASEEADCGGIGLQCWHSCWPPVRSGRPSGSCQGPRRNI